MSQPQPSNLNPCIAYNIGFSHWGYCHNTKSRSMSYWRYNNIYSRTITNNDLTFSVYASPSSNNNNETSNV